MGGIQGQSHWYTPTNIINTNRIILSSLQAKHNKSYPDPEEDAKRLAIYKESLAKIDDHNEKFKKGEVTWEMGVNHFADQTPEERSKCHGPALPKKTT